MRNSDHGKTAQNPLLRLLAVNALSGAALGIAFVAALLWLDVAQLRSLMLKDTDGAIALALLLAGFIVTCASIMMGSALMTAFTTDRTRGDDRDGSPLVPVPVTIPAKRTSFRPR